MREPSCDCANPNVTLVKTEPWEISGENGTGRREQYRCLSCKKEFDRRFSETGGLVEERTKH
jgi:hypothetical protein